MKLPLVLALALVACGGRLDAAPPDEHDAATLEPDACDGCYDLPKDDWPVCLRERGCS